MRDKICARREPGRRKIIEGRVRIERTYSKRGEIQKCTADRRILCREILQYQGRKPRDRTNAPIAAVCYVVTQVIQAGVVIVSLLLIGRDGGNRSMCGIAE